MKVYTKTGDRGETSLAGGCRVSKDDCRVEAYGTVDELSAHVAVLRDAMDGDDPRLEPVRAELTEILRELMTAGSLLACAGDDAVRNVPPLRDDRVEALEQRIDRLQSGLPGVRSFVLPGGHPLVSQCQVCRTVCRRAERRVIAAAREYDVPETVLCYVNRLSDYFYSLGRKLSDLFHVMEIYWTPGDEP